MERMDRTEKCVVECDSLYASHVRIIDKLRVNVEKHRHIHRLASIQSLFLKAEALYLGKVWRNLTGRDAVRSYADDIVFGGIRCGVERESCFSW